MTREQYRIALRKAASDEIGNMAKRLKREKIRKGADDFKLAALCAIIRSCTV